jgi:hypothetical protein
MGIFSMESDNSMCPGSAQPLKNEYQDIPGGKDGWCVGLTTYHLQVSISRNLEALTSQNPLGPIGLYWECFTFLYCTFMLFNYLYISEFQHCKHSSAASVILRLTFWAYIPLF